MQFDNPAQRRDYERLVASNPNNVAGMPAFFPPIKMQLSVSDIQAARECECGGCCIARDGYKCPRCGKHN